VVLGAARNETMIEASSSKVRPSLGSRPAPGGGPAGRAGSWRRCGSGCWRGAPGWCRRCTGWAASVNPAGGRVRAPVCRASLAGPESLCARRNQDTEPRSKLGIEAVTIPEFRSVSYCSGASSAFAACVIRSRTRCPNLVCWVLAAGREGAVPGDQNLAPRALRPMVRRG
jgi:hypothetical protein